MESADGAVLSKTFAAVPFGSVTLYPVQVVTGADHFFSQAGDRLQLSGTIYQNGFFFLFEAPLDLGTVPYSVSEFHGDNGFAEGIAGFETIATPAGNFATVVLTTPEGRQWWSPGVGLVQLQTGSGKIMTAARIFRAAQPEIHNQVAHFTSDVTAIVTLDGIYTQDGAMQVRFKHEGQRSSTRWADIGAGAPVASQGDWSQVSPHWRQTYYAFHPETGKFQPVVWRFPGGEGRTQVVGMVEQKGTSVELLDDGGYPMTRYRFEWAGGELKAVAANAHYPETEERFVRELTQPLRPEAWISLFIDPATGRKAYDSVFRDGRNILAEVRPNPDRDGGWTLEHPGRAVSVRLTLIRTDKDWRVVSWTVAD
ncbi:MAG TPA: hypothetical protein VNT01_16140 [Symbiobacteriaceae bacterium]|nr:hypothetical protein [Symbiobacteriaceae bacterium]